MRVETNSGKYNYYTYKQGYWFLKNGTDSDKDWKEVELVDKEKKTYKEFGVYVSALGGIVSSIELEDIEHEGRKFSVLNVKLDDEDNLSMSFPSEAARKVLQQFANLDFTKRVVLNAWLKDGWSKLNIKQDGEHVKNSFMTWDAENHKMNYKGGYPVRPGKDASERDKGDFAFDEKDFLRAQFEKIKGLVPEFVKIEDANAENDMVANEAIEQEEIEPSSIPF